jgi:hypothetical protein
MLKELRLAECGTLASRSSLPQGSLPSAPYSIFCPRRKDSRDYSAMIKLIPGEASAHAME